MKFFGYLTSVIIGVLSALISSTFLIYPLLINLALPNSIILILSDFMIPSLITSFITSLLISKDAYPPNFIINEIFIIRKYDNELARRITSGIFSCKIYAIFITILIFLRNLSNILSNIEFFIIIILIGLMMFAFFSLIFGGLGGKYGVLLRDLIDKKSI